MSKKSLVEYGAGSAASVPMTRAPLFIAMSCIGSIAAPALAEDTVDPDSIIVRGQLIREAESPKSTAPLLDTPQTITVIGSNVIRDRGATTLTDVLRNTPGISFNAGENGFATSTNNFSLRGFDDLTLWRELHGMPERTLRCRKPLIPYSERFESVLKGVLH